MTTNLVKQKQMIVTAQRKSITSINLIDEIPEAILEIIFYYAIGTNKLGSIFFIRKIKILSKRWRNWIFSENVFSGKSLNELAIKNAIGIQKVLIIVVIIFSTDVLIVELRICKHVRV